jgi:cysteine desulfurase family protein
MQVYLDNAATSFPKPEVVYTTIDHVLREVGANPGRSGHKMAIDASRYIYDARVELATLFNVPDEKNIIFTYNTTDSLNIGIKGLLKPGDHAVTTSMEHNSVLRPLHKLNGIGVTFTEVRCKDTGELDPADVEKAINEKTRLIVATHASNICGTIINIDAISEVAKKHGVIFMVDAAQTAGAVNIDLQSSHVDMLACAGHKSLFGPQGTGVLYVRDGLKLDTVKEGGTGSHSESLVQPDELPDKFESGTLNTPGIAGLGAGVRYILSETVDRIREKEMTLVSHILDEFKKMDDVMLYGVLDPKKQTSVISFNVKGLECSEVGYTLDSTYNIMTRVGVHCSPSGHKTLGTFPEGTVRASVGYFNTHEEVDYFINSIREIIRKR